MNAYPSRTQDLTRTGILSTYPPRHCGIATFARDLAAAVGPIQDPAGARWLDPRARVEIIALDSQVRDFPDEVRYRLDPANRADYADAARWMNERDYDVIGLQHEFGIYGGPDGEWVLELLELVDAPVVTTLHTVLASPSTGQRRVMEEIGRLSSRIVTLSSAASSRLGPVYRVDPRRVEIIAHGVPDLPFVDPELRKPEFGLTGRPTVLSFGLLGPGKGYELAIDAMASVVARVPDSIYVILGSTHPELRKREGERYRELLAAQVLARGLAEHVRFVDAYVDRATLGRWLQAADVFVTPYPGAEQVVSGTLAYALGAGKALVSTPYAYARELLAEGRGELVPFGDSAALGQAIGHLLADPVAREQARRLAYRHGRGMIWPVVGDRYRHLFADVAQGRAALAPEPPTRRDTSEPRSGTLIESAAR